VPRVSPRAMANPSLSGCLLVAALVAAVPLTSRAQVPGAPPDAQPGDTNPPPPPPEDEQAEEPPPPEALPPQNPPTLQTFEADLAPYGRWVNTPEYGQVWVPNADQRADWQPYTDGHWVYTQWGWSFVSDVPWGWAPFHYGRWGWTPQLGWFWVPGSVWAPAWVSWRYNNGHVAWAPFAPRGYRYDRRWPGWVTVPLAHFTHPIERERVPRAHAVPIVRNARPAPSIQHEPERGRTYGPPRTVGRPAPARPAGGEREGRPQPARPAGNEHGGARPERGR
jgi:hypothetical protein